MSVVRTGTELFFPGDYCGPYEIVRRIGEGGYAQVFEAIDEDDCTVALKVLRLQQQRDVLAARRLLKEATILNQINHRYVVGFKNWGTTKDKQYAYLAMQLINGQNLRRTMRERAPIPVELAVQFVQQLCEGLHELHRRGLVHRDIKPENVMITPDATAILIDFGIVRDERGLGTISKPGTLLYMSPQHLAKTSEHANPSWDTWAASLILFECVAGFHPFNPEGEVLSHGHIVQRVLRGEIPRLADLVPSCPAAVSAIVERGLSRDPTAQWTDGWAMASALSTVAGRVSGVALSARAEAPARPPAPVEAPMAASAARQASAPPVAKQRIAPSGPGSRGAAASGPASSGTAASGTASSFTASSGAAASGTAAGGVGASGTELLSPELVAQAAREHAAATRAQGFAASNAPPGAGQSHPHTPPTVLLPHVPATARPGGTASSGPAGHASPGHHDVRSPTDHDHDEAGDSAPETRLAVALDVGLAFFLGLGIVVFFFIARARGWLGDG
ncbi:MAG: serine/threonine-protein kinase [Myxococcota bacterium]